MPPVASGDPGGGWQGRSGPE